MFKIWSLYLMAFIPGIASLILFLVLRVRKKRVPAVIAKAVTSVFFIISALAALYSLLPKSNDSKAAMTYGFAIVIGLVCGLLGDIWLDLKFAFPDNDKIFTYGGFLSFAAGHVFYFIAVYTMFTPGTKWLIIAAVLSVLVGVFFYVGEKLLGLKYGPFKTIVACYVTELVFVMLSAVISLIEAIVAGSDFISQLVVSIGMILFLISDAILSNTYFKEGYDRPFDIISNHVAYYLAQFILAASVLTLPVLWIE